MFYTWFVQESLRDVQGTKYTLFCWVKKLNPAVDKKIRFFLAKVLVPCSRFDLNMKRTRSSVNVVPIDVLQSPLTFKWINILILKNSLTIALVLRFPMKGIFFFSFVDFVIILLPDPYIWVVGLPYFDAKTCIYSISVTLTCIKKLRHAMCF